VVQYVGYKSYVSLDAESGLITSILPTSGKATDNEQFAKLPVHDKQVGAAADVYTGAVRGRGL